MFSGELEFAFRHVLLRDVAYESLPKALRSTKHADVAGWAGERAGPLGEPPRVGSEAHPVLGDGAGTYIHT